MSGVKLEFSQAYWIENGTLIPTTTTTNTSTNYAENLHDNSLQNEAIDSKVRISLGSILLISLFVLFPLNC